MEISDFSDRDISDKEIVDKISTKIHTSDEPINQKDVEMCRLLCGSSNGEARSKAIQLHVEMARKKPKLVSESDEILWEIISSNNVSSSIKISAQRALEILKHDNDVDVKSTHRPVIQNNSSEDKDADLLSVNAMSLTVTKDRLRGNEAFFMKSLPTLRFGEQPHFLFALSKGTVMPDWSFAIEKLGKTVPVIEGDKTGSLVVTDLGIRILTRKDKRAIKYDSITHVQYGSYPSLKIHTGNEVYQIRLARTIHSKSDVSDCASFIIDVAKRL